MSGVNKCIFVGNVGRKPELKKTKTGKSVCNFSIAINEKKDAEPLWVNVTAFERTAETCAQYLDKGRQVYVEGRLQIRQYEKDGEKKTATEIVAGHVVFIGGDKDKGATKPAGDFGEAQDYEAESDF